MSESGISVPVVSRYTLMIPGSLGRLEFYKRGPGYPEPGLHALSGWIDVELRNRVEHLWVVWSGSACLAVDLADPENVDEWQLEYESMPSSRTDEYLARTRFSLGTALNRVERYLRSFRAMDEVSAAYKEFLAGRPSDLIAMFPSREELIRVWLRPDLMRALLR